MELYCVLSSKKLAQNSFWLLMMRTRAQPGKLTTLINGINKKTHRKESQVWVWLEQCEKQKVVNLNLTQYEFSIPPCINPTDDGDEKRISCVQFHSLSLPSSSREILELSFDSSKIHFLHRTCTTPRVTRNVDCTEKFKFNDRQCVMQEEKSFRRDSVASRVRLVVKSCARFFTTIELYFMATFRVHVIVVVCCLKGSHCESTLKQFQFVFEDSSLQWVNRVNIRFGVINEISSWDYSTWNRVDTRRRSLIVWTQMRKFTFFSPPPRRRHSFAHHRRNCIGSDTRTSCRMCERVKMPKKCSTTPVLKMCERQTQQTRMVNCTRM